MVERNLAKVDVAGSSPVSRSPHSQISVWECSFIRRRTPEASGLREYVCKTRRRTQVAQGSSLQNCHSPVRIWPTPLLFYYSMIMPEFIVYVLQSEKDGTYYTGYTTDINKRISQHNSGESKSTKNKRPYKLVYNEVYYTRSEAMKREKYLKTGKGREFLSKIL